MHGRYKSIRRLALATDRAVGCFTMPRRMHVAIINQYALPSGVPGITRHGDLGAELARRGHRVTILASRFHYLTREGNDQGPPTEVRDGVEFRWLDTGTYARNDRRRSRSILAFTLGSIVTGWRMPKPDVIVASSPHLLAGISGLVLSRRFGVPFVFEIRDLWPSALVDLGALRRGSLLHRGLVSLERLCYRAARKIITVPPHADRRVREVGGDPSRCVHIPNATTAEPGTDLSGKVPDSLMAVLDQVGNRKLLIYAGAQGISNDLSTLLRALATLVRQDPSASEGIATLLIGDGSEHASLVEQAARLEDHQVFFHRPVDKAAVRPLFERADALLVSFADAEVYDYGLSPNKLFDYMAAGRPVLLASRLTDTPVDEANAGRRYEPGSAESLATALTALMSLPEAERDAMGERGRRLVAERYTIPVTGAKLEALLLDVVSERR